MIFTESQSLIPSIEYCLRRTGSQLLLSAGSPANALPLYGSTQHQSSAGAERCDFLSSGHVEIGRTNGRGVDDLFGRQ